MEFVINQTGEVDVHKMLDYLAKQFGNDMRQMLEAKNELAKRQGAMVAVEASLKARADADAYYQTTKATCDAMLAETTADNETAKVKKRECLEREKAVIKAEAALRVEIDARTLAMSTREASLVADRAILNDKAFALEAKAKSLADAEVAHAERVDAFRKKVAQITA